MQVFNRALGQAEIQGYVAACAPSAPESTPTEVMEGQYDGHGGPWTAAGSPYIVTEEIVIPRGGRLTIEPGVEVRFDGNYGIDVFGALVAEGSAEKRILFTSNRSPRERGNWKSIYFEPGGGRSSLSYCTLEYGGNDSGWGNANVCVDSLSSVSIRNTISRLSSEAGLRVMNQADPSITECEFTGNGVEGTDEGYGTGFYSGSSGLIEDCEIRGNFPRDGIYLEGSANAIVRDCTIAGNKRDGIWAEEASATISGCTITENEEGDRIRVDVAVEEPQDLLAAGLTVHYDPAVLRCVEVRPGNAFPGSPVFLEKADPARGVALINTGRLGGDRAVAGSLAELRFERLGNAASQIAVEYDLRDPAGEKLAAGTAAVGTFAIPEAYALHHNQPNPFNAETAIAYELPETGFVRLQIFNLLGQEMRELLAEPRPAGRFSITWDGRDGDGEEAGSGVYIYRMVVESQESGRAIAVQSRRMLLVR